MSTTAKRRVVVVVATETIGKALSKRLLESGYELVVFSPLGIQVISDPVTSL